MLNAGQDSGPSASEVTVGGSGRIPDHVIMLRPLATLSPELPRLLDESDGPSGAMQSSVEAQLRDFYHDIHLDPPSVGPVTSPVTSSTFFVGRADEVTVESIGGRSYQSPHADMCPNVRAASDSVEDPVEGRLSFILT